jgi:hypothetical protein
LVFDFKVCYNVSVEATMKKILVPIGQMALIIPVGAPLFLFEGNPLLQVMGFFTVLGIMGLICLKLDWM